MRVAILGQPHNGPYVKCHTCWMLVAQSHVWESSEMNVKPVGKATGRKLAVIDIDNWGGHIWYGWYKTFPTPCTEGQQGADLSGAAAFNG